MARDDTDEFLSQFVSTPKAAGAGKPVPKAAETDDADTFLSQFTTPAPAESKPQGVIDRVRSWGQGVIDGAKSAVQTVTGGNDTLPGTLGAAQDYGRDLVKEVQKVGESAPMDAVKKGGMVTLNTAAKIVQPAFVGGDLMSTGAYLLQAAKAKSAGDDEKYAEAIDGAVGRLQAIQGHVTWGLVSRYSDDVRRETDKLAGHDVMQGFGVDNKWAGLAWDVLADPAVLATLGAGALKGLAGAVRVAGKTASKVGASSAMQTAARVAAPLDNAASAAMNVANTIDLAVPKAYLRLGDEVAGAGAALMGRPARAGGNKGRIADAVTGGLQNALRGTVGDNTNSVLHTLSGREGEVVYGFENTMSPSLTTPFLYGKTAQEAEYVRAKAAANTTGLKLVEDMDVAANGFTHAYTDFLDTATSLQKKGVLTDQKLASLTPRSVLPGAPERGAAYDLSAAVSSPIRETLQAVSPREAAEGIAKMRELAKLTGNKLSEEKMLDLFKMGAELDYGKGLVMEHVGLAKNVTSTAGMDIIRKAQTLDDLLPAFQKGVMAETRVGENGVPVLVKDLSGEEKLGYATELRAGTDELHPTVGVRMEDGSVQHVPDEAVRVNDALMEVPQNQTTREFLAGFTGKHWDDLTQAEGALLPQTRVRPYLRTQYTSVENHGEVAQALRERNLPDEVKITDEQALTNDLSSAIKTINDNAPLPAPTAPRSEAGLSADELKAQSDQRLATQGWVKNAEQGETAKNTVVGSANIERRAAIAARDLARGERGGVMVTEIKAADLAPKTAADVTALQSAARKADPEGWKAARAAGKDAMRAFDEAAVPFRVEKGVVERLDDAATLRVSASEPALRGMMTPEAHTSAIEAAQQQHTWPITPSVKIKLEGQVQRAQRHSERLNALRMDARTAPEANARVNAATGEQELNAATERLFVAGLRDAVRADPEGFKAGLGVDDVIARTQKELEAAGVSARESKEFAEGALATWLQEGRITLESDVVRTVPAHVPKDWRMVDAPIGGARAAQTAQQRAMLEDIGKAGDAAWVNNQTRRWVNRVVDTGGRAPTPAQVKLYQQQMRVHQRDMRTRQLDPQNVMADLRDLVAQNPHMSTGDAVLALSKQYGGLTKAAEQQLALALHNSEGWAWTAGDWRLAQAVDFLGGRLREAEMFRVGGGNRAIQRSATENQFGWLNREVVRQALQREADLATVVLAQHKNVVGRLSRAKNMQMMAHYAERAGEIIDGRVYTRLRENADKLAARGKTVDDMQPTAEGGLKLDTIELSPAEAELLRRHGSNLRVYTHTSEVATAPFASGWVKVDGRTASLTNGRIKEGDLVTNHVFAHLMVGAHVPDVDTQFKVLVGSLARANRYVQTGWLSSTSSMGNEFIGSLLIPAVSGRLAVGEIATGLADAVNLMKRAHAGDPQAKALMDTLYSEGVTESVQRAIGQETVQEFTDLAKRLDQMRRGGKLGEMFDATMRVLETQAGTRNMSRGVLRGGTARDLQASAARMTQPGRALVYNARGKLTDLTRVASTMAFYRKGLTIEDAAWEAAQLMGDMRNLPMWAQAMNKVPLLAPFMSWTQHASALTLVTLMTRPRGPVFMAKLPGATDANLGNIHNNRDERDVQRPNMRSSIRIGEGRDGKGVYLNLGSYNFVDTPIQQFTALSGDRFGSLDGSGLVSMVGELWSGKAASGPEIYSPILGFNGKGGFPEAFAHSPVRATGIAFETLVSRLSPNQAPGGRQAQALARTIVASDHLPDDGTPATRAAKALMEHPGGQLFVAYLNKGPAVLSEWARTGGVKAALPVLSHSPASTPTQDINTVVLRSLLPVNEVQGDVRRPGQAYAALQTDKALLAAHRIDIAREWPTASPQRRAQLRQQLFDEADRLRRRFGHRDE